MSPMVQAILVQGVLLGGFVVTVLMSWSAAATWWERKFAARMQNRVGPRTAGPMGILQPLADAFKMMQKEDITPRAADWALFQLAPVFPPFLVLATAVVIPFAGHFDADGHWVSSAIIADVDVGMLWVLAMAGLVIFPNWMAGYASANKYTLIAAMRGVAQGVSYEIPLVLTALVPVIAAGDFTLSGIVAYQAEHGWFALPTGLGSLAVVPIGFVAAFLFFMASLAESNRIPFDIPEAESELVAGVLVEYTGIKFGIFMLTEYTHTVLASLLVAVMFLGGPHFPGIGLLPSPVADLAGAAVLVGKTGLLFVTIYWIRWSWYRFRADQLMELCWNWLVPISLLLVMLTALVVAAGWAP